MSLSTKTTISVLIKSKKFISVLTPKRKKQRKLHIDNAYNVFDY